MASLRRPLVYTCGSRTGRTQPAASALILTRADPSVARRATSAHLCLSVGPESAERSLSFLQRSRPQTKVRGCSTDPVDGVGDACAAAAAARGAPGRRSEWSLLHCPQCDSTRQRGLLASHACPCYRSAEKKRAPATPLTDARARAGSGHHRRCRGGLERRGLEGHPRGGQPLVGFRGSAVCIGADPPCVSNGSRGRLSLVAGAAGGAATSTSSASSAAALSRPSSLL